MNNTAVNVDTQYLSPCFQFLGNILRSEIAASTLDFLYARHCAVYFMPLILFNFRESFVRRYYYSYFRVEEPEPGGN